jgi:hypothetical protein
VLNKLDAIEAGQPEVAAFCAACASRRARSSSRPWAGHRAALGDPAQEAVR